ncbi:MULTISPECIES: hypothetical protein [Actinosynnema]|uniref:hypothetical protein n=1 Tax=Actinosynnema TaxID=40566 RepID=UPI0020A2B313|nr:hypothetical protein [Actinosynnema pretiosum]MCP2097368.1 hypothetical protein [Actinosynnema pretiosum]
MSGKSGRAANETGALWEYRLARLRFFQGYLVRRSIDIWPEGPQAQGGQLGELDVVATALDPTARRRTELIEAKSGRVKEVERILWMHGLGAYTRAQEVTLAKARLDQRVRPVARRVKVNLLDEAAVDAAEKALGIGPDEWVGHADPDLGEGPLKAARSHLGSSEPLKRAGKFLFGSFWTTATFARIRQLHTLTGLLREHHAEVDPAALVLACGEVVALTALTTWEITHWRGQYEPVEFGKFAVDQLNGGLASTDQLHGLLEAIDTMNHDFVEKLHEEYTAAGVARLAHRIPRLQHEMLRPPEWAEAFMDLTERLQERGGLAMHVLRALDLRVVARLGSTRDTGRITRVWDGDRQSVEDTADLVERFCTSVWGLPAHGLQPVPSV